MPLPLAPPSVVPPWTLLDRIIPRRVANPTRSVWGTIPTEAPKSPIPVEEDGSDPVCRGVLLVGRPTAAAGDLPHEEHDRVVVVVDHSLLEGDDGVVGDADALRADLGAALGDVAVPEPRAIAEQLSPVVGVERVHLERCVPDEQARTGKARLVLLGVADHVAHVLAEEALDALVELLDPVDVLLLHP